MAEIKDKPAGLPSGNDLDKHAAATTEPAYIAFGRSPAAMDNPPERGETRTYLVRAHCKGKSELERLDGEIRRTRNMEILAVWEPGQKEPVITDQMTLDEADGGDDSDGDGDETYAGDGRY